MHSAALLPSEAQYKQLRVAFAAFCSDPFVGGCLNRHILLGVHIRSPSRSLKSSSFGE